MEDKVTMVTLGQIRPNPFQPDSRLKVDKATAKRFADSIKKDGLIHIPVVRPCSDGEHYEIADGWLRYTGYKHLRDEEGATGYNQIPVIVRFLTDQQMADTVLTANIIRKDLSDIDKAKLYVKYLETFKVTQAELAKLHNLSQGEIANTIRLLELPGYVQKKIISQEITPTHGRSLLQLKEHVDEMLNLADTVAKESLTVSDLDGRIREVLGKPAKAPATQQTQAGNSQSGSTATATATAVLTGDNKPETVDKTNPITNQGENKNEPQGAEIATDTNGGSVEGEDDDQETGPVEITATAPPQKNKAGTPPAAQAATPPAAAPVPMPTPPKPPDRKLNIIEAAGAVTISLLYPGNFVFIKKLPVTLEKVMEQMPAILKEANEKYEGEKK